MIRAVYEAGCIRRSIAKARSIRWPHVRGRCLLEKVLAKVRESNYPPATIISWNWKAYSPRCPTCLRGKNTDLAKIRERQREKEIIKRRLATLIESS